MADGCVTMLTIAAVGIELPPAPSLNYNKKNEPNLDKYLLPLLLPVATVVICE